jgi:transposase-like protein
LKAAKRFGISALTFYTWRKKAGGERRRAPEREARAMARQVERTVGAAMNVAEMIRREIRAEISRVTPDIIKSEVGRVFPALTGMRRRRG